MDISICEIAAALDFTSGIWRQVPARPVPFISMLVKLCRRVFGPAVAPFTWRPARPHSFRIPAIRLFGTVVRSRVKQPICNVGDIPWLPSGRRAFLP
jgi:hypothetical protein